MVENTDPLPKYFVKFVDASSMHYIIIIAKIFKCLYGYEAINILLRFTPSRYTISILKYYGANIGERVRIQSPLIIHNAETNLPIYANLTIGDDCYVGRGCIFDLMGAITIGNKVTISHRAVFNTHTHAGKSPIGGEILSTSIGDLIINDGVYIGSNVTILESVEIGHNTIVGACSLVNRDLPGYVIAFGVPSRIQKKIR